MTLQLALLLKKAALLHEGSYKPPETDGDFGSYSLTISDAAEKACAETQVPQWEVIVNCMLWHAWNDALDWADQQVNAHQAAIDEHKELMAKWADDRLATKHEGGSQRGTDQ